MKHILTLLLTFLFVTVAIAQEEKVMKSNPVVTTITGHLIKETPSLRNLKFTKHFKPVKVRDEDGIIGMEEDGEEEGPNHKKFPTTQNFTEDPALQKQFPNYSHGTASRAVGANFDGMPYQPLNPPDPSLCVGPNHVIQMINGSGGALLKVYDKTGGQVIAQTYLSALTGLQGGGDPIALYDQGADRFILTEFAPPSTTNNGLIVAISTTNDPAGAWKVYYYSTGTVLADYPKYSVWNNAYYATTNDFSGGPNWSYIGSSVYAFDRAGMLAGNTSVSMQKFNMGAASKHYSMSPVSWQGTTEPVSGTGGLIAYMQDDTWTGSVTDSIGLFEFKVNFTNPSLSAVIQRASLAVAANKADVCDADRGKCIPQPGTSTKLEALAQRVMNQPIYRNFGSYEGIVLTYTVDKGSAIAAPRWYELIKTGSTWSVYQQSTFSPDNTHRWMPAICYDAAGNIGLVYNVSDGTSTYPGIRYAGRKRCDILNIMSYEENVIIAGTASNVSSRYGDYNQLVCDPDGVKFWMTAEYNASSTWSTRISSFTLGGTCPIGEPASQTICSGENIININLSDNGSGTTYSWTRDNTVEVTGIAANGTGDIFGSLNNTTNAAVTVTFTITPISNSSAGTPFTVTVVVNAQPTVVVSPVFQAINTGEPITPISLSGSSVSGTVYNWTRDNTTNVTGIAASGTGDISGTLIRSGFGNGFVSFNITPTANGCAGATIIATVSVNRLPTITCQADNIRITSLSPNVPIVISKSGTPTITSTLTIPDCGLLSYLKVNIPDLAHTYVGDLTATLTAPNGTVLTLFNSPYKIPRSGYSTCTGDNLSVSFEDNAILTADNFRNTCGNLPAISGNYQPATPFSTIANSSIKGVWTLTVRDAADGDGGALNEWGLEICYAPQDIYTITLSPGANGSITGNRAAACGSNNTYTITPDACYHIVDVTLDGVSKGAVGSIDLNDVSSNHTIAATFALTIYTAVASPASQLVCSGSPITNIALTGNATTYNWTRDNDIELTGIASSGSGNIIGTLTNKTNAPVMVTFTITPTANGCLGTPITATVVVNPTPNAVATPSSQTKCSADAITTIALSGNVSGTTYSWTRDNALAATGIAASGSGDISGNLTNTTNAPVTVTFTITPTANGCTGTPITATVVVNPTPNAVATPSSQTKCSADAMTTIALSGNVSGTTYSWIRDNALAATGIATSGTGDISGTLTNTTKAPVTVTFTITPTANGCVGTPITATVVVNPTPTADAPADVTVCGQYTLPALTAGNYFTGTGGTGTAKFAGDVISSSQTLYVYAQSGTNPNCKDEHSFNITVNSVTGGNVFSDIWVASTDYPINILDEATASVGNYLYSFGGVSDYAIVSNSYKFDGTVWTPIAPLPVELEFPTAVSDGTNIYILGGFSVQSGIQTTMYRYNVAANNYTLMAPFSTAVWNHAVVYYLNNKIYKFCGTSNQGSSNQLEIYDISSDTWSLGAPYPIVNSFVSASVIGNYIYGAGGLQTSGDVLTLNTYRYDPASNSWDDAAIADLPQTRMGAASCLHSSSFIMAGGYVNGIDLSNISTSVISWDPVSNTWTELPNMLAERARMAGAILNGNFYVIGGRSIASSGFYGTNSNQKLIFNDVCSGGDPAAFTEAKSSTGTGTLSYQWQSSTIDCSNGFTDIPGATSTTYDPPAGLMQTTYYRRVTTSTLNGAISCSANSNCITVVVKPTPNAVATPLSQTKCSGDAITTIALSGNVSGTTYSWTRDNALAATGIATSGTGDISGTLTNTTNAPVMVTFTITPTANGCAGTPITATVFVNPTPDVTQPANQTVCNGAPIADVNFTGSVAGTIFNWTNDNPSIGLAASGTEDIKSFTGTNTTNAPITATVTVTPEVELIPELLYYKFDGTGASIPNLALAPPVGTSTATIQGGQQQGSPGICGAGSLIGNGSATDFVNTGWAPNLGNNNWTMSFKTSNITPSVDLWYILGAQYTENFRCFTNGVAGSNNWLLRGPFNDVLVTGGATIEPHTITFVYDNTLRNIKAYLDGILNNTVSQNEMTLTGAGPFKIGGRGPYNGPGLPNGGKMDEFCLFNRALTPAEVLRLVQCRPNGGCTGPSRTFTITVNPTPNAIATPVSQTKCSGEAITTIALSGKVIGTTYSWTRDNALAATGIAASGTGDISGTLTNTTNAPVTVTFTITPTANGCLGTSITATVVVNPTPTVTATPSSQAVCSAIPITTIVLTGSVSGTVYNWTRNNTGSTTGIAANGSGNISGTLTNATYAPVTVTFTITPTANGCAGSPMTATVLLNPLTNTSNPGNQSIYALENTSYSVTATGGGPLTYKWQESTNGGTNFNNLTDGGVYSGTATNTLNLIAVPGNMNGYKYRCVVTSGCSVATSAAALLTVTKRPTILTYTGDNSEQYSDQQLLTAVLKDQRTNTVLSSKTVSFTLGTQSVSDGPSAPGNGTDANGLASATLRMYQNPGNYTVASSFAGDVNYVSSTDSDPFRITKENAITDYTGPQFISVPCATCATTNVLLSASVRDTTAAFPLNDIYPGDIRKARVKFINLNTLTDISGWLTPALISTSDTTKGTVVFNWTVPIPSNGYDVYSIGVIVDSITNTSTGNYIGKAETVLSVSRAGLSEFISGGGNIIPTASAGQYASDAGLKTNFGFNVKFNRNYTNLQGNLNIIFRRSGRLYQIKATSMNSLSINTTNPCAKQALFTSKANLIDITNPSAPISIYGGITLQVTMMDKGDQGNTDQIGVTLWNGSSLVYSSKWVTTQTVEMLLNGGNILIHSGANCTTTITKTTNNQSVEQPAITSAKVYPNPFNKVTTISYNLPTEAQVSLAVYNIFGKKIAQLVEGKLPAGQYESKFDATKLISGFYFYRLESTDAQGKKVLLTGKMLNTK